MSIVARYELSIVEIVPLKLHLSVILILSDCRGGRDHRRRPVTGACGVRVAVTCGGTEPDAS